MSLMIESDVEAGCRVYPRKPWTLGLTIDSVVIEANLTIGIKTSDAIGLQLYGTNSFLQGEALRSVRKSSSSGSIFPR